MDWVKVVLTIMGAAAKIAIDALDSIDDQE